MAKYKIIKKNKLIISECLLYKGIKIKKFKIIIIDPNAEGGHNNYCHSLSKILSYENDNVVYINREDKIKNNIPYKHIATGNKEKSQKSQIKSYIMIYLNLRRYAKQDYTLHFQSINYYMMFLIIALRFSMFKPLKLFYTLHNLEPHSNSLKEKIKDSLLKYILALNMFQRIVYHYEFYDKNNQSTAIKIPKKISQKMYFIPHHMFEENIFGNNKNVENGKINILLFGVMRDNKGILEFFKLLSQQNGKIDQINFIIAGKFTDYSKEDLMDIIHESKSPINIRIINRFISDKEKEKFFTQAHYILLPYKKSFLAQSGLVLDAYQYKVPLIVSENTSLKFLAEKESSGFSFNSENIHNVFEQDLFSQNKYLELLENIQDLLENKYSNIVIKNEYHIFYFGKKV